MTRRVVAGQAGNQGLLKHTLIGCRRRQRKGISLQSPKWLPTLVFKLKLKFEAIDHVLQLLFYSVEQQLDRLLFDSVENKLQLLFCS